MLVSAVNVVVGSFDGVEASAVEGDPILAAHFPSAGGCSIAWLVLSVESVGVAIDWIVSAAPLTA